MYFLQPSPVLRKRNEVAAHAVPLEPLKFEVGANIEAMDGYRWYKAKIMKVKMSLKNWILGWQPAVLWSFSCSLCDLGA